MNPISAILGLVTSVVGRIWPDKTAEQQATLAIALQEELDRTQLLTKQIDVNAVEAANPNIFVSGWRPAVGWVCALAFIWAFFLQPMFLFFMALAGKQIPTLPALDLSTMMPVLMGLLGMAGFRTFEKVKGVARP